MEWINAGDKLGTARARCRPPMSQYELSRQMSEVLGDTPEKWRSWIANTERRSKVTIPGQISAVIERILGMDEGSLNNGRDDEPANARPVNPATMSKRVAPIVEGVDIAVPVWRGVAAGMTSECEFIDDSTEFRSIPSFFLAGARAPHVLCTITGMSMARRVEHGGKALVRLDTDVPPGHLVVARSPESRNYIKALVSKNHRLELHSLAWDEDAYPPIVDLEGWTLKGGVVAIWHAYKAGTPNIEWNEGQWLGNGSKADL